MKLFATTVLLSIASASAFSAYLNNIGGGAPPPAAAAPAPSAADYLSALDDSGSAGSVKGAGLTSYLDTMAPSGSVPRAGAGLTSYLDDMSPGSSAVSSPAAPAPAAPAAPASAASAPAANSAPAAGDYLDALNTKSQSLSGGGITSYLDALPPGTTRAQGAGLTGYLGGFQGTTRAASGPGIGNYLNTITHDDGSNRGNKGSGAVGSFLENVHSQIMSLPDDGNRKISGDTVTYSNAEGSYAMSFTKK